MRNISELQKPKDIQNAGTIPPNTVRTDLNREKLMPTPDSNIEAGCSRTEILEKFVILKRDSCAEKLREAYQEFADEKDVAKWFCILGNTFINEKFIGDNKVDEFLVWQYLSEKFYWNSFKYANSLLDKNESHFSEEEKRNIVEVMVSQIMQGEKIASSVPLYSDVWNLLEKNKDHHGRVLGKSYFAAYVTEEHKRNALNIGFWNILKATENSKQSIKHSINACEELSVLLNYDYFYKYFDLKEGVNQAKQIPDDLELMHFNMLESYIIWYLVQKIEIERSFAERPEQIPEITGKIIAPIISRLMIKMVETDEEREDEFKKLISFFVKNEIIRSKAMQYQLGVVFETNLKMGFERSDYFSSNYLQTCEKTIVDLKPHISRVWEKVKNDIDLVNIPSKLRKYIPRETSEAHIKELKEKIVSMKKLDSKLFTEWMAMKIDEDVPKSVHGLIRNKAFEVYFSQRQRPSGNIVFTIYALAFNKNHVSYKVDAFLLMDSLLRKKWTIANEILMSYDNTTRGEKNLFYDGLGEYVKAHGKVLLSDEGISLSACYPQYNKIVDFKNKFPKLFKELEKSKQKPI